MISYLLICLFPTPHTLLAQASRVISALPKEYEEFSDSHRAPQTAVTFTVPHEPKLRFYAEFTSCHTVKATVQQRSLRLTVSDSDDLCVSMSINTNEIIRW